MCPSACVLKPEETAGADSSGKERRLANEEDVSGNYFLPFESFNSV